jgi:hypothetical protein
MIKVTNTQAARIIGALLILLSGDAFAVRVYATQDGLDTEISNRKYGDSRETARATKAEGALTTVIATETARVKAAELALKAADTAETARAKVAEGTLTTAIATETARAKAAEGSGSVAYIVGESHQGGIIFWVDPEGQHGLIAAKADQNEGVGIRWYNDIYFATNATADGIYAGAKNTDVIVAAQASVGFQCAANPAPSNCAGPPKVVGNYAALVAAKYSIQEDGTSLCTGLATEICYGDWYLPSKFELNLLYTAKIAGHVGGFANNYYWSSTENDFLGAWFQHIRTGSQNSSYKYDTLRVRAVRAF